MTRYAETTPRDRGRGTASRVSTEEGDEIADMVLRLVRSIAAAAAPKVTPRLPDSDHVLTIAEHYALAAREGLL